MRWLAWQAAIVARRLYFWFMRVVMFRRRKPATFADYVAFQATQAEEFNEYCGANPYAAGIPITSVMYASEVVAIRGPVSQPPEVR